MRRFTEQEEYLSISITHLLLWRTYTRTLLKNLLVIASYCLSKMTLLNLLLCALAAEAAVLKPSATLGINWIMLRRIFTEWNREAAVQSYR
jgi:hypothetical protein